MASKRQLRRKSCLGKKKYTSSQQAKDAAFLTGRKHNEKLVAYHCNYCGSWHIGHPPVSVQRRLGYSQLLRDFK
jgi:hypothetical protein